MSIVDGQRVNAADSNPAWISKNTDDTATGEYTLANVNAPSGPSTVNIQREINSLNSFSGRLAGSVYNALPAWSSNIVGTPTDNTYQRADFLTLKYRGGTGLGHKHDGTDGQSEKISGTDLINVVLKGFFLQGTDLTGVTGGSTDVSTELTGKAASTVSTALGVVVNTPYNKVVLRYASGANEDDIIVDGSGDQVYGRVTESVGVWTLTYYTNVSGTETPYSFGSATDVRWYYQELFNPLATSSPVYSELAIIPSDNATADVIDATTSLRGLVNATTQSFGGNKTFVGNVIHQAQFIGDIVTDSTTTGSNATLTTPGKMILRLTNASLVSIEMISPVVNNLFFVVVNKTGATITLKDNTGATASQRILTGTGTDLSMTNDSTVWLVYDTTSARWVVVGGSGGGASGRAGNDSITNGATSKAVTFSTALASTNYAITATIVNTTDASPMFIPIAITAKSTTGFTATWNVGVDSANYVLSWSATLNN